MIYGETCLKSVAFKAL